MINVEQETEKLIPVKLAGKAIIELPESLPDLAHEIEKSKYMLALPENFDEEGGIPPTPQTWSKAVRFIAGYAVWLLEIIGKKMATPKIYHGPDGSIDIYWENERFNLLINIPVDNEPATYYGDDYFNQVTEGKFHVNNFQQALIPNLSVIL